MHTAHCTLHIHSSLDVDRTVQLCIVQLGEKFHIFVDYYHCDLRSFAVTAHILIKNGICVCLRGAYFRRMTVSSNLHAFHNEIIM